MVVETRTPVVGADWVDIGSLARALTLTHTAVFNWILAGRLKTTKGRGVGGRLCHLVPAEVARSLVARNRDPDLLRRKEVMGILARGAPFLGQLVQKGKLSLDTDLPFSPGAPRYHRAEVMALKEKVALAPPGDAFMERIARQVHARQNPLAWRKIVETLRGVLRQTAEPGDVPPSLSSFARAMSMEPETLRRIIHEPGRIPLHATILRIIRGMERLSPEAMLRLRHELENAPRSTVTLRVSVRSVDDEAEVRLNDEVLDARRIKRLHLTRFVEEVKQRVRHTG